MKRRFLSSFITLSLLFSLAMGMAGCSASSKSDRAVRSERAFDPEGEAVYSAEADEEIYGEASLNYAAEAADIDADFSDSIDLSGAPDVPVDVNKKMLIYRCNMVIDTLDFESAVSTLKSKVKDYNGFIEREEQNDGASYSSDYVIDEDEKSYYFNATIRIPSANYESFVSSTDGLGYLRSKNSTVDNVTTEYGTLKAELEIYEAEYERYLVKFEETKDDAIALTIEKDLRDLAIKIADIKTSMSVIEGDVAYSYVTVTIRKVNEIVEDTPTPTPTPVDDRFSTEFKETAKESWNNCLEFFQSIILFFVRSWWGLIIFALIVFGIIFFVKRCIRRGRIRRDKERQAREAREIERVKAIEKAKAEALGTKADDKTKVDAHDNKKVDEKTKENDKTNEKK